MVTNSPRLTSLPGWKQPLPPMDSAVKMPVFFIHSAAKRQELSTVSVYCLASVGFTMVMVTMASRETFPAGSVAV